MEWLAVILILPYLCLFLWIYINILKIKPFKPHGDPALFVSVIIASRNEERNLPVLLDDILVQDYSPDLFEVIVVDDNSEDKTFALASEFAGIRNLKVIRNEGSGKKQALRTGIGASSGSFIITTDADCRPGRSWLSTIASAFGHFKPNMIIGQVVLKSQSGFFNRFQELEFLALQGVTAGTAVSGNPVLCNGANLAFTKDAYNEHSENLHNELVSGDDIFLLHSIKKAGSGKIIWLEAENSIVSTQSSATTASFLAQRARWLSKAGSYSDVFTLVVAIVTFVTILVQAITLIAGIFVPKMLILFMGIFLIKSIPDFLILLNATTRYSRKSLLRWFIPSQFAYPFYVIGVVCRAVFSPGKEKFNSPYPRGI